MSGGVNHVKTDAKAIDDYKKTLRAFTNSRTVEEVVNLQGVALEQYDRMYHDHIVHPGDNVEVPPDSYALQDQIYIIERNNSSRDNTV